MGVGTVIIPYIGVAYTRGGGGSLFEDVKGKSPNPAIQVAVKALLENQQKLTESLSEQLNSLTSALQESAVTIPHLYLKFLNDPNIPYNHPEWGTGIRGQSVVTAYGASLGHCSPEGTQAHGLVGRGGLPSRWSVPLEHLWGMATPNGTCSQTRGDGDSCSIGGRCLWSSFWGDAAPNSTGPLLLSWVPTC